MFQALANSLSIYKGLPRDIYIIALAKAIAAAGSFIFPMLTLILSEKLGFSPAKTGFIVFLASTSYVPGSLIGGKLADSIGRKVVLVTAEGVAGIAILMCGFFPETLWVLPLIFVAFACMGAIDPAALALATDLSSPDNRKAVFSLSYLGHNVGIAVGPLFAGLLFLNHSQWLFWGDGITTLLAVLLIILFVRESKPDKNTQAHTKQERAVKGSVWPILWQRPHLIIFTFISILLTFSYAQLFFSLPLQMAETFAEEGPKHYGYIMTINALFVLVSTPIIIAATKKIKSIFNVVIAGSLYAIGFGMIYFIAGFQWFVISTIIWTAGEVLSVTNSEVYIAQHSPQSHRGRINSLVPLVMGMGWSMSPLLGGIYIQHYGVQAIWPLIFALSATGALLLFILGLFEKTSQKEAL